MKDRKQKINKDYPWVVSFSAPFFLNLFYSSVVIYNVVLMSAV